MNSPSPRLPAGSLDDTALAEALADGAAEVLLALRADVDAAGGAFDPKAFKDAGDAAVQDWLARALAVARPDDATLSEEAKDDVSRTSADRVWIIDPWTVPGSSRNATPAPTGRRVSGATTSPCTSRSGSAARG